MKIGFRDFDFNYTSAPATIVEIGVNAIMVTDLANELILEAKKAGGDIVKFQGFVASEAISIHAEKARYQFETSKNTKNQLELVSKLELSQDQLKSILKICNKLSLPFLCTAFESTTLNFLVNELNQTTVKVASGEVTNIPFLAEIAKTGVGIILSTGASDLEEVACAIKTIKEAGNNDLILLHCVSEYPAKMNEINLGAMNTMKSAFNIPVELFRPYRRN